MNYTEARAYIERAASTGSILGLESIRGLLKKLGNPQEDLKFIHIAGTNGKGSVLSYISSILQSSGYSVGRYISPTLFHYKERIQTNKGEIEEESFARHLTRIAYAIDYLKLEGEPVPTVFEIETALSFLYFKEQACDFVILETGLGGLEDATNVVETTLIEVFTSISLDHIGILGNTLKEIAVNKAGIIKPRTWVVTTQQEDEVMEVLESTCVSKESSLVSVSSHDIEQIEYGLVEQKFEYKGKGEFKIRLIGSHQIENAALAIKTVETLQYLGYEITMESIRKGLLDTKWKGRFSILSQHPFFIIDGAHNEAAAKRLKESLELYFPKKRIIYIMGMFKDKEYEKVAKITVPLADYVITITPPNGERALDAECLKEVVEKYQFGVESAGSIEEAVKRSYELAHEDDVIIAFGSLSFLGMLSAHIVNKE
jgi:dihydrofolate synthase/folylpolyglutamate synthase